MFVILLCHSKMGLNIQSVVDLNLIYVLDCQILSNSWDSYATT